jgi:hypothetical protein
MASSASSIRANGCCGLRLAPFAICMERFNA